MHLYVLVVVVLVIQCAQFNEGQKEPFCRHLYEPVGCYKDKSKHHALGTLILTDRDERSRLYSGQGIDWENFEVYVQSLACRCAMKAKEMGFTYFGLQYYGECYGSRQDKRTFDKYGSSDDCTDGIYGACENPEAGECVGKGNVNFVYRIANKEGSAVGLF